MTIVITSRFNPARRHPVTGVVQPHNGTDFRAPTGTPIYAAMSGTLTRTTNSIAGNRVHITSGTTRLGHSHLSRFGPNSGTKVKRGDVIGYAGATGSATGAHLHFDVQVNGKWVNPEIWLATQTGHPLKPLPSKPKDKDMPSLRFGNRKKTQNFTKDRWTTVQVTDNNGVSTAFGSVFDTNVTIHFQAPTGTQVRGRFYKMNYVTGKRGYTYDGESKVDSPVTTGNTMMFSTNFKGELGPDERLRFEVYTWNDNVRATGAAYRTHEW